MIDLIAFTNATVDAFQRIGPLVAALDDDPQNIVGYIDEQPKKNSLGKAIYQMRPGSVLVAWQETTFEPDSTEAWIHRFQYYVRARRGESSMQLIFLLVNGIPDPGDGMVWRFCPLMDGLLPTEVVDIARVVDEEGIDYFQITTQTREIGDQNTNGI